MRSSLDEPLTCAAIVHGFFAEIGILFGLFGSRLNLALREEAGTSYGVHGQVHHLRLSDRSVVLVVTAVDPDAAVDAATRILSEQNRLTTGWARWSFLVNLPQDEPEGHWFR